MRRALLASIACAALRAAAAPIDDFESLDGWSVEATEGVKARIEAAPGREGRALCLAVDFGNVSGYALVRKRVALDFPADFELAFDVRGEMPANALHVRFADESGDNVWWHPMPRFEPPRAWERIRLKRRHIVFAWGPAKEKTLHHAATVEFAIAREQGGQGRVCFDDLTLVERPPQGPPATPVADASSSAPESAPALAVDGARDTAWRSAAAGEQAFTLDLGARREFGGLVLRWLPGLHARRYDVQLSDDGEAWRTVRRVAAGGPGTQALRLEESEARFVRLRLHEGEGAGYALAEAEVRPLEFGASENGFIAALAKEAPRGRYPRGFSGEQPYWTIVGVDGGPSPALLSEDGALEPAPAAAAIEPFLLDGDRLVTWADVRASHRLAAGNLPMPAVRWDTPEVALDIAPFAMGSRERGQLVARYRVENRTDAPRTVTLVLALRPFQVNPPSQFLNTVGGAAHVRSAAWDGTALTVDGARRFWPSRKPDRAWALPFDAGNLVDALAAAGDPPTRVDDPQGLASAAMAFRLSLPPHGQETVALLVPLTGAPRLPEGDVDRWIDARERETIAEWRGKLDRVRLTVPPAAQPIADTLRTALAHVLVSRAGPALRPGTRAYARSWIRDGAMMSESLLRMGHAEEARAFADWFGAHLFPSGKVPCCVDARGADPVPENDSAGEWIHLVSEYARYTGDVAWLRKQWPGVMRAVTSMDRMRDESRQMDRAEAMGFAGLLPPSISHEGYSDKPAWSYWDDFWGLAGYRAAADLARTVDPAHAAAIALSRDEFARDIAASVATSRARHRIDFIPGSADRGDFDATSTTIALAPADALDLLPRAAFDATFERYWREFTTRRDGAREWEDYTPYELRNVGALLRLGRPERAREALAWFMRDRRPAGWNQWAEVVGRDARKPRFIGDMPHGWVASDFIAAALDLFAYERRGDRAMVIAAGVAPEWIDAGGVAIEGLRTPWGAISYALRREGPATVLRIPKESALPPGGFVVPAALAGSSERRITRLPARVVLPGR